MAGAILGRSRVPALPVASDLHALLRAAAVPPPYVLVGASGDGFPVRVFAGTASERGGRVWSSSMRCMKININGSPEVVWDGRTDFLVPFGVHLYRGASRR